MRKGKYNIGYSDKKRKMSAELYTIVYWMKAYKKKSKKYKESNKKLYTKKATRKYHLQKMLEKGYVGFCDCNLRIRKRGIPNECVNCGGIIPIRNTLKIKILKKN